MCSCGKQWGKPFHCYQLWHPPNGWEIVYLPWNFWHNMLFMITTFMPNFKVKTFIQKKNLQSTNVCSCEIPFIKDIEIVEVCQTIMLLDWNSPDDAISNHKCFSKKSRIAEFSCVHLSHLKDCTCLKIGDHICMKKLFPLNKNACIYNRVL